MMSLPAVSITLDGEMYVMLIKRKTIDHSDKEIDVKCLHCQSHEVFEYLTVLERPLFDGYPDRWVSIWICTACHQASEYRMS